MNKHQKKSRKKKKTQNIRQQNEVKARELQARAADVEQMLRKYDWRTRLLEQRLVQTRLCLQFHAEACGHTSIAIYNDTFPNIRTNIERKVDITPDLLEEVINSKLYPKLCRFIEPLIVMETTALNVGAQCKVYLERAGMRVTGTPITISNNAHTLLGTETFSAHLRFGILKFTPDEIDTQMCYRHAKAIGACYGPRDIVFRYTKPPCDVVEF